MQTCIFEKSQAACASPLCSLLKCVFNQDQQEGTPCHGFSGSGSQSLATEWRRGEGWTPFSPRCKQIHCFFLVLSFAGCCPLAPQATAGAWAASSWSCTSGVPLSSHRIDLFWHTLSLVNSRLPWWELPRLSFNYLTSELGPCCFPHCLSNISFVFILLFSFSYIFCTFCRFSCILSVLCFHASFYLSIHLSQYRQQKC